LDGNQQEIIQIELFHQQNPNESSEFEKIAPFLLIWKAIVSALIKLWLHH